MLPIRSAYFQKFGRLENLNSFFLIDVVLNQHLLNKVFIKLFIEKMLYKFVKFSISLSRKVGNGIW